MTTESQQPRDPLYENLKKNPELIQDPDYQVALDARGLGRTATTDRASAAFARGLMLDMQGMEPRTKDASDQPTAQTEGEASDKSEK